MACQPVVSVLLPNYNNGRQSSIDGQTSLISLLIESLRTTLADDPTPLEIIAYDDGSTDDSLQILREAAATSWRSGEPLLRLIEAPHTGVLAAHSNRLVREARGNILVRLDGDTELLTPRWAQILVRLFEQGPEDLGIVGPMQLLPDGRVHAFGDWLLHPKGYHHIGRGMAPEAFTHAIEVDHVMGACYCFRREVFDSVGGFDEQYLRGQTIDFGMKARLHGWRCLAVPDFRFVHRHGQRCRRQTQADSGPDATAQSLAVFERKWGFNRAAPDLEEVARRYAGTPLLWNRSVFGSPFDREQEQTQRLSLDRSDWARLGCDAAYQQSLMAAVTQAHAAMEGLMPETRVVIPEGAGPLSHVLALKGWAVTAVDRRGAHVGLARQVTAGRVYPGPAPRFVRQDHHRRWPVEDRTAGAVLLVHTMEQHPNPVALLLEARRVLRPGGILAVVAHPMGSNEPTLVPPSRDGQTHHGYRLSELLAQVQLVSGFEVATTAQAMQPGQPALVVGRRQHDAPAMAA